MRGSDTLILVSVATAGVVQAMSFSGQRPVSADIPVRADAACCLAAPQPPKAPAWSSWSNLHAPAPLPRAPRGVSLTLAPVSSTLPEAPSADFVRLHGGNLPIVSGEAFAFAAPGAPVISGYAAAVDPSNPPAGSAFFAPSPATANPIRLSFQPMSLKPASPGETDFVPPQVATQTGPANPPRLTIAFAVPPTTGPNPPGFGTLPGGSEPPNGSPQGPIIGPPSGDFGVPEPATSAVFGAALLGLALCRRSVRSGVHRPIMPSRGLPPCP